MRIYDYCVLNQINGVLITIFTNRWEIKKQFKIIWLLYVHGKGGWMVLIRSHDNTNIFCFSDVDDCCPLCFDWYFQRKHWFCLQSSHNNVAQNNFKEFVWSNLSWTRLVVIIAFLIKLKKALLSKRRVRKKETF